MEPERHEDWETPGRVDRRRILYSRQFQRLAGITQVSAAEVRASHLHNRLTHSLQVADLAGRIAGRLRSSRRKATGAAARALEAIDIDAIEAAALAHDLGHPPFGHLGEMELDRLAVAFGGFEGNAQTFRILTRLAVSGATVGGGMNLTRQTLGGTLKYPWVRDPESARRHAKWNAYLSDSNALDWARDGLDRDKPTLEAEVIDWADDVTYAIHDMTDYFKAGLIPLDRLCTDENERRRFSAYLETTAQRDSDALLAASEALFAHGLMAPEPHSDVLASRIVLEAQNSFLLRRYGDALYVANGTPGAITIQVEARLAAEVHVLKQLTWHYVINQPGLAIKQEGERRIIQNLFERFVDAALSGNHRLLPTGAVELLSHAETDASVQRVVVDYVAGLTEAGARELHAQFLGTQPGSIYGGIA